MLGENITILRKQKGLSQELLAQQMCVVRQTVSKWEKGLSVPDAEMLARLSEILETPVSTLLSGRIEEEAVPESRIDQIAAQLAILNEQLAEQAARRRRLRKRILAGMGIGFVLLVIAWAACIWSFHIQPRENAVLTTTNIRCTLDGETYSYGVTYDRNFQIYEAGGDAWIANHVQTEQYEDANVLLAQIEDYVTLRGGTYTVVEDGK